MNSIDYEFGYDDYDTAVSNHGWDDAAQVNMAQIDDIKNHLNFTDVDDMLEFAIHGIDLLGVNSDYIRTFCHEVNAIANDFCNNRVPFDKTHACLICGQTGHDFFLFVLIYKIMRRSKKPISVYKWQSANF